MYWGVIICWPLPHKYEIRNETHLFISWLLYFISYSSNKSCSHLLNIRTKASIHTIILLFQLLQGSSVVLWGYFCHERKLTGMLHIWWKSQHSQGLVMWVRLYSRPVSSFALFFFLWFEGSGGHFYWGISGAGVLNPQPHMTVWVFKLFVTRCCVVFPQN